MFNLSLTACSFHLRKANAQSPDSVYDLNKSFTFTNEDGDEITLDRITDLFECFFHKYEGLHTNNNIKRAYRCEFDSHQKLETETYTMLYARIYSGIYGSSSEIINGDTGTKVGTITSRDIVLRPFYLFIFIPKEPKCPDGTEESNQLHIQKGILIFQNVGPYGIKTVTTTYMQEFFSSVFGVTIRCATISPDLFINTVIKPASIRKLVMVKNMKSVDVADNCSLGYGKEVREIANLTFSESMWSKLMDSIHYVSGSKSHVFEFENQEYQTLKLDVDIGGRTRRIDLHNLDNLSIIEAIPDSLQGADGHPILRDLIPYFQNVANEYLSEMVLRIT